MSLPISSFSSQGPQTVSATNTTSNVASTGSYSAVASPTAQYHGSRSDAEIVGAILGTLLFLSLAVLGYILYRHYRSNRHASSQNADARPEETREGLEFGNIVRSINFGPMAGLFRPSDGSVPVSGRLGKDVQGQPRSTASLG
jgi:hypothetical protein